MVTVRHRPDMNKILFSVLVICSLVGADNHTKVGRSNDSVLNIEQLFAVLCCVTVLAVSVLYCIVLHCTVLYCTLILYCTVLSPRECSTA